MSRLSAISFAATCAMMIAGPAGSLAQGPPGLERESPIWSNRDMSLRWESTLERPDLETVLRFPNVKSSEERAMLRPGDVVVCEPGRFSFGEDSTAAYAHVRKLPHHEQR